jgi:hypothetical protein
MNITFSLRGESSLFLHALAIPAVMKGPKKDYFKYQFININYLGASTELQINFKDYFN